MRQLLIRPGGIGDCLLCFPAMEALAAGYTEVWAPLAVAPLVGFASAVRPLSSTGIDMLGLPGVEPPRPVVDALRSFDRVVSWYGAARPEFRAALHALCPEVRFLPALPPPANSAPVHAADFFAAQVGARVPAVPIVKVVPAGEPAVWIHPFSGGKRKNWPLERFRVLADALGVRHRVEWAETEAGVRFESLADLAGRLSRAIVYVGNDSGITHLAAAAGAPAVAIFGPTDPRVWAPRGERVRIVHDAGLEHIEAGRVLEAVRSLGVHT